MKSQIRNSWVYHQRCITSICGGARYKLYLCTGPAVAHLRACMRCYDLDALLVSVWSRCLTPRFRSPTQGTETTQVETSYSHPRTTPRPKPSVDGNDVEGLEGFSIFKLKRYALTFSIG